MYRIDEDTLPEWKAKFDPTTFKKDQKELKMMDWKLSQEELEDYVQKVFQLRQKIKDKAQSMIQDEEIPLAEEAAQRSRKGMKHSTKMSNDEGLLEKEMRQRSLEETPVTRKYKPRHRSKLSSDDITKIVEAYTVDFLQQKEIAKKFRVTPMLVHKLVKESQSQQHKLRDLKQKERIAEESKKIITKVTSNLLEKHIPIEKAKIIQTAALRDHQLDLSIQKISKILREDMGLTYRRARPIAVQCNSERCLVLRSQYAQAMIDLLEKDFVIINVDESAFSETNYTRYMWCKPRDPGTFTAKSITPRLSLIAALDTLGNVYYSLSQVNTDSDAMMLFMTHLTRQLDIENADWREKTIFLFDGATYHTSEEMKEYFRKLEVQVIFSGPYSYSAAPIENLFAGLKRGELNTGQQQTGKRSLAQVNDMVGSQLAKIKKGVLVSYWHSACLQLFKYLDFERI